MLNGRLRVGFAGGCLLLLAAALATSGCRTGGRAEDEILRLESSIERASATHNAGLIDSLVVEGFQYWSYTGERRGKSDLLRTIAQADEATTQITDPVVHVYGDTAIYTARVTDTSKGADGTTHATATCVTDVFARRGGRWQWVASHESLVPAR